MRTTTETERARDIDDAVRKSDAAKAADAAKAVADAEFLGTKLDVLLEGLGKMNQRLDAMEKTQPAQSVGDEGVGETTSPEFGKDDPSVKQDGTRPNGWNRRAADAERAADARADSEEAYRAETNQHAQGSSVLHSIQWDANRASEAWGKDTVKPWDSESISGYRRRVAREHQSHSPQWKNVDLGARADIAQRHRRLARKATYARPFVAIVTLGTSSRNILVNLARGWVRSQVDRRALLVLCLIEATAIADVFLNPAVLLNISPRCWGV